MTQQTLAKILGSNNISADFHRYVNYIETSQAFPVRVTFVSLDDLKISSKYFVDRAISHPKQMKFFAEGVKRIFFVTPINGEKEMNFRKAVVYETQAQLNELCENLSSQKWKVERAVNLVKLFGELYNIEFIFNWILKKYLDAFKLKMDHSVVARRCFYALIETVKNDVPRLSATDHTAPIKLLREMIEDFEKNPPKDEIEYIPAQLQVILPPKTFKSIINNVNKENSKEILIQIANYKTLEENETWQKCYELLIEKALSAPELAETIILICKKLPGNNKEWRIKSEDYKKLINQLLTVKLENLFENAGCRSTQNQVFRILHLIKNMMENSICSIGSVAKFVEVLVACAEKDKNLAAKVLFKLLKIIKVQISADKIKKLPGEKRDIMMAVLKDGELSLKFKKRFSELAEYLGVEFENVEYDSENESKSTLDESFDEEFNMENLQIGAIGSPVSYATPSSQKSPVELFDQRPQAMTSGWNAFFPNFPSFVETLNHQKFNRPETFENLIESLTMENSDEVLRKLSEISFIPDDEFTFELLIEKVILKPELVDTVVEVFKKVLRQNTGASTSESESLKLLIQTMMNKLEIYLSATVNGKTDYQILNLLKLVQKLFEYTMINQKYIKNAIKLIKSYENGIYNFKPYLLMLEDIVRNFEFFEGLNSKRFVTKNNEMSSSSGSSSFDSEEAKNWKLRSPMSSTTSSAFSRFESNDVASSSKISTISNAFLTLELNDLKECAQKVTSLNIETIEELKHFSELIIKNVRGDKELIRNYAKLSFVLGHLKAGFVSLKTQISESCKDSLINSLTPKFDDSKREEIYSLVEFIGELHTLKAADPSLISYCFKEFFTRELSCFFSVHCIDILIRKLGLSVNPSDQQMLDSYFKFFEQAVKKDTGLTYRNKIYKTLIELKDSGWKIAIIQPHLYEIRSLSPPDLTMRNLLPDLHKIWERKQPESQQTQILPIINEQTKSENHQITNRLTPTRLIEQENYKKFAPKSLEKQFEQKKPENFQQQQKITSEERKKLTEKTQNPANSFAFDLKNIANIAKVLKNHMKTPENIEKILISLIAQLSNDKQKTFLLAKLFKELAKDNDDFASTFKETLNENIFKKFATFNCKKTLDDSSMSSFENILLLVSELYKEEIFSVEDICFWLQSKHTKNISLENLNIITKIISIKVLLDGDSNLMRHLKDLEILIHDETMKTFSIMRNDIEELNNLITKNRNYSL